MGEAIEVVDRRPVVVCAVALKTSARAKLAEMLGDVRLVDIRESVDAADVVLAPVCSPQAIGALKDAYPSARIVVVELEDWEHDIELGGPVTRLREAGIDAYLTADSLEDLASQLTTPSTAEPALALDQTTIGVLNEANIDDLILERVEQVLAARARAAAARPDVDG